MNDRQTHIDLLAQVADSTEERDNVRRILSGLTEADLDAQEKWKRAPFPIGATNRAHSYSVCRSGPCEGGAKLCPSPEACQLGDERPPLRAGDFWRVVALVVASWAAVAAVLLALGVRL